MKKVYVYIPCYINDNERFKNEISATIDSLMQYPKIFDKIKFFICQKDKEIFIKELIKSLSLSIPYEILYNKEKNPRFLPITVFQYMQKDEEISDDDFIFYDEADHILNINDGFWSEIKKELEKWNIVMPHRLWKTKALKDKKYTKYWEYFVWNFFPEGISEYNKEFDLMQSRTKKNNTHNAYAWCFFTQKKTISDIYLKKYYWVSFYFVQFLSKFHKYDIYKKILFKRKILPIWFPFWLILETPSLVLSFAWKNVLKPKRIKELYVIHLSQDSYV